MSGTTIVSSGSVTVQSSSANTGIYLSQIQLQLSNTESYTYENNTSVPAPAIIGENLVFTLTPSSTVNIDPNYGIVLTDSANTNLTGGSHYTDIISGAGGLTYTGSAGEVVALGSNSIIHTLLAYAKLAFGGTGNSAVVAGNYSTLSLDNGSSGVFTVTGTGAIIVDGSVAPADASVAGAMSTFSLTSGSSITLADAVAGDSAYVILNGGANTVSAQAGTSTISALTGGDVYFGSNNAATLFVGATSIAAAVSTIFGGGGNSTVFGEAGVLYTEGSGNNTYVGGIASVLAAGGVASGSMATSTITATTGHDTIFGGTVSTMLNLGQGSELFVGGGASDTLMGGSIAPVVFGNSNEDVKLIGTATGGVLVALGATDTIDASLGGQHNDFFISNAAGIGNTTLIGSLAAPGASVGSGDIFVVSSVAGAAAVAHTITIENFQTNDAFFLSGYSAADDATFAAAATATPTGSMSVTLSDNTTIRFIGNHPTQSFDGGATNT